MPKTMITNVVKDKDTGLQEFGFMVDGKKYKVLPKEGQSNKLDEFYRFVRKAENTGLNPFIYRDKEKFEITRENPSPKPQRSKSVEQLSLFKAAQYIDDLSDILESKNYKKYAYRLDIIANTIDDNALKTVKATHFWDEVNNQEIDTEDVMKVLEAFDRGADTEYSVSQIAKVDTYTTKKILDIAEKTGIIDAINVGKWPELKKKLEK